MPRIEERRAELLEAKAEAYARAKDWQPAIEAFKEAIAVVEGRRKKTPEDVLLRKELAEFSSKLAGGLCRCWAAEQRRTGDAIESRCAEGNREQAAAFAR